MTDAHKIVSVPTDYLLGLFLDVFQQCDKMDKAIKENGIWRELLCQY